MPLIHRLIVGLSWNVALELKVRFYWFYIILVMIAQRTAVKWRLLAFKICFQTLQDLLHVCKRTFILMWCYSFKIISHLTTLVFSYRVPVKNMLFLVLFRSTLPKEVLLLAEKDKRETSADWYKEIWKKHNWI